MIQCWPRPKTLTLYTSICQTLVTLWLADKASPKSANSNFWLAQWHGTTHLFGIYADWQLSQRHQAKKTWKNRAQVLLERSCILGSPLGQSPSWRYLGYCNLHPNFFGSFAGIQKNILTAFCRSSACPACPPMSPACIKVWIHISCTEVPSIAQ